MQVAYKTGELYLSTYGCGSLREYEIEDIAPEGRAVKIRGEGWVDGAKFHETVKCKLGRVEYTRGLFGMRRTVIRGA